MSQESPPGEPSRSLPDALARFQIELPADQVKQLDHYCRLLWAWNEKINLTRHDDYDKFVARDLVDSLKLSEVLAEGEDVLDVGSGGGVPGIVLAILRPDISVSLCESMAKKVKVLEDIVRRLRLETSVFHARAEELLEEGQVFDVLTMRGVARLEKLLTWFNPYWGSFRRLLLIKGPAWVDERAAARERRLLHGLELRRVVQYVTPDSGAESCVLQVQARQG